MVEKCRKRTHLPIKTRHLWFCCCFCSLRFTAASYSSSPCSKGDSGGTSLRRPSLLIPSLFRVLALSLRLSSSLLLSPPPHVSPLLSLCKSRPHHSPFPSPDVHPSLSLSLAKYFDCKTGEGVQKSASRLEERGGRERDGGCKIGRKKGGDQKGVGKRHQFVQSAVGTPVFFFPCKE